MTRNSARLDYSVLDRQWGWVSCHHGAGAFVAILRRPVVAFAVTWQVYRSADPKPIPLNHDECLQDKEKVKSNSKG